MLRMQNTDLFHIGVYHMLYIYATALANIGLHHLWVPEVFHQVLTREGGQRAQYMIKKKFITSRSLPSEELTA